MLHKTFTLVAGAFAGDPAHAPKKLKPGQYECALAAVSLTEPRTSRSEGATT